MVKIMVFVAGRYKETNKMFESLNQLIDKLEKHPFCCICGHQLDENILIETKEYNKYGFPLGLALHCPHCKTKVRITGKIWSEYGGDAKDEN